MVITLWPLLLPLAAASGWYLAKRSKTNANETRDLGLSRDYFMGLNYLINEQHDKAVDVFLKLLEVDSNTVETHLALGSLFRRRGEVDRAIRIHQNLIARPQLDKAQRVNALLELGRDYMSAGVFDRAEGIFQEIVTLQGQQSAPSLRYLLTIYQQEKAWEKAIEIAQKIEEHAEECTQKERSHYYCELAEEALTNNQYDQAQKQLREALAIDHRCARASLLQADLEAKQHNYKAAIKLYKRVKQQDPDFLSEAIPPLVECYEKLGDSKSCLQYLQETLEEYPRIIVVLVLANSLRKFHGVDTAMDFFTEQLHKNPSIRGLKELINWHLETAEGKVKNKLYVLQDLTAKLLEDKPVYRCSNCGFSGKGLHWHCPGCKQWSTVKPIHGIEGD